MGEGREMRVVAEGSLTILTKGGEEERDGGWHLTAVAAQVSSERKKTGKRRFHHR